MSRIELGFAGSRPRFGAVGSGFKAEAMSDMNTTPLIDVMLVLLIMFIITIPPQRHSVTVDLPQGTTQEIDRIKNRLTLTATGTVGWNGSPIEDRRLVQLLRQSAMLDPAPELHFEPSADTRYERVDAVLAMTRQAGVTKLGFVGNQRYQAAF